MTRPILGRWKKPQPYLVGQMAVVQFRPTKLSSNGPIKLWSAGYFRYPQPDEWCEIVSRDSVSRPEGENSRSEVECEARQSGAESASPK